jgi:hypothetical protein
MQQMRLLLDGMRDMRDELKDVRSNEEALRGEVSKMRDSTNDVGASGHEMSNEADSSQRLPLPKEIRHGNVRSSQVETGVQRHALDDSCITVSTAHKLYYREFESDRVTGIGDYKFPTARMTWKRLVQDFPVRPDYLRRLVGVDFGGPAKKIYEELSSRNLNADADELWELLEQKLYNVSQQRGQRASFYSASWKEKMESIEQYGSRLATSALSLPDHISEEALVNRLSKGYCCAKHAHVSRT